MGKWKKNLMFRRLAAVGLAFSCAMGSFGNVLVHAEPGTAEAEDEVIVAVSERQQGALASTVAMTGEENSATNDVEAETASRKFWKPQHEKDGISVSLEDCSGEWNLAMVSNVPGSDTYGTVDSGTVLPENRVKVAIIDSGVDDTGDIDVYMRKNFIPGEDEVSILYEDSSCHGTSVAGVIAALDNEEGITGINPEVLLYSARVLDAENRAPVSRVVEAIDWAIAQDVDIINLSFGTTVDSPALRAAVQRAYAADILLVAAAGNQGIVEYPAAYEEVIAVGAVDVSGNHSMGSAVGNTLELVAPGEQIVSTGAFGGVCVAGGTSLAAPHVTGIASVLWQQDKSMPADFIRTLLDFTANQYGDALEYGYGLVDLEFALSQYDSFKEVYQEGDTLDEQIAGAVGAGVLEYNEKPVVEFENVEYVEGLWVWKDSTNGGHQDLLADKDGNDLMGSNGEKMTSAEMKVLKAGAIAPDKYCRIMQLDPEWHGYSGRMESKDSSVLVYHSNYVLSYILITKIASAVYNSQLPETVTVPSGVSCVSNCTLKVDCVDKMLTNIKEKFDETGNLKKLKNEENTVLDWSELLSGNVTKQRKAIYIYGMALHSVTDMFAHSSYTMDGKHINHMTGTEGGADDKRVVPNRYDCARAMCRYTISHIKKFEAGSIEDFSGVFSTVYDKTFKLRRLNKYIEAVDSQNYQDYSDLYDGATRN